jgi:UMF1 family MFS transporter
MKDEIPLVQITASPSQNNIPPRIEEDIVNSIEKATIDPYMEVPQPVTTKAELFSWIIFDWASTVFSAVSMGAFVPLVLEQMAFEVGTVPGTSDPCKKNGPCNVPFGFFLVDTASFVLYVLALSVVIQTFSFITFGALADYGNYRKPMFIISSTIGAVVLIFFAFLKDSSLYYLAATFTIICNVAYGLCLVYYNSYLPVLISNHPTMLCPSEEIVDLDFWGDFKAVRSMRKLYNDSSLSRFLNKKKNTAQEPTNNEITEHSNTRDNLDDGESNRTSVMNTTRANTPLLRHDLSESNINDCISVVSQETRGYIKTKTKQYEELANRLSAHASASGHVATLILILISSAITFSLGPSNSTWSYQLSITLCGIWWLFWSFFTMKGLQKRPGRSLPPNSGNYIIFGWKKIMSTLGHMKRLPNTFTYILAYFLFSDSFATIGSVAILFARKNLGFSSIEIGYSLIIAPFGALTGIYFWLWVSRRFGLSTRTTLAIILMCASLIPIYALLGFLPASRSSIHKFTPDTENQHGLSLSFGLQSNLEFYVCVFLLPSFVSSATSFGRVLYTDLIPQGHESEFFAFYEITDRGTSWVGPLVAGAIKSASGDLRFAFIFILVQPFSINFSLNC